MKNFLISLLLLVSFVAAYDDAPWLFLEPEHIKGEWVSTQFRELPNGLYAKQEIVYRIGIDPLPNLGPFYKNKPMTFIADDIVCYLGDKEAPEQSFDYDRNCATLTYTLVCGPRPVKATFMIPMEDSLCILIGNKIMGARRR